MSRSNNNNNNGSDYAAKFPLLNNRTDLSHGKSYSELLFIIYGNQLLIDHIFHVHPQVLASTKPLLISKE